MACSQQRNAAQRSAAQCQAAQQSTARNRTQRSSRPRRPKRPLTAIEQAKTCRSEITTSAPASAPALRASNSVSPTLAAPHAHAPGRMGHHFFCEKRTWVTPCPLPGPSAPPSRVVLGAGRWGAGGDQRGWRHHNRGVYGKTKNRVWCILQMSGMRLVLACRASRR